MFRYNLQKKRENIKNYLVEKRKTLLTKKYIFFLIVTFVTFSNLSSFIFFAFQLFSLLFYSFIYIYILQTFVQFFFPFHFFFSLKKVSFVCVLQTVQTFVICLLVRLCWLFNIYESCFWPKKQKHQQQHKRKTHKNQYVKEHENSCKKV